MNKDGKISLVLILFLLISVILIIVIVNIDLDGRTPYENTSLASLLESKEGIENQISIYKSNILSTNTVESATYNVIIDSKNYSIIDDNYIEEPLDMDFNGSRIILYKIDQNKYKKNVSTSVMMQEDLIDNLFIDDNESVYFVFDNYDSIPKWVKKILENGKDYEKQTLANFIVVKDNGEL